MTLPASGALSLLAINAEFGRGLNLNAYRGTTWFTDAGATGTFTSSNLGFDQFYSKRPTSPSFSFTISSGQTNANLRSLAISAGWNQSSALIATISGGVYISSNSTGTPALTVNGSFPGGVSLTNNGIIVGMGGNGASSIPYSPSAGSAGGTALSVSSAITITNNGTIAGGGGGGGAGGGANEVGYLYNGGGGGGGRSSNAANSSGGTAGGEPLGAAFRSIPGNPGTVSAAGTGGRGHRAGGSAGAGGTGGTGGDWGAAGSTGAANTGLYYPSVSRPPSAGGSSGLAISGNSNISWAAFGTRLGGIS